MSFNFLLIFSITVFVASIIPGPIMLLAALLFKQVSALLRVANKRWKSHNLSVQITARAEPLWQIV
jgi:hypothetical protein